MRILVVEDEPKLAEILRTYLEAAGFEVECVADGLKVMASVEHATPDLVLLDLMLPGRDGLDVCRDIRAYAPIPIIMVTARTEEIDRLLGLELGADDYICKPYSPREVVARVKAVLRRSQAHREPASACEAVGLEIEPSAYLARLDGVGLDLTPVEFRLLALLASHPGRIFSRDQVLDGLYDDHRVVTDRAVDSHVKNLRRKLAQVRPGGDLIRSVYGVGYRLDLLADADESS
ncbi:MAG: response regulator [Castellaniella sp.]|uniref:response regulator n=1 Tax=Castellaniella sp. TaxID=1955812 RepID=UPI001203CA3D|nr:response regulator [Castellaniella sp.]TAN26680.1 MAG: response regulator [Castellaniella sp.]